MAEGEGHTLEEAFESYARNKAVELLSDDERETISLKEATERFDGPHWVDIAVKLRPTNQWVKGFKVRDAER
jgi:hypothetical protein